MSQHMLNEVQDSTRLSRTTMTTTTASGTRVDEIADRIYRISTPSTVAIPGGFTFNQFLIVDEAPLLFHTGHAAAVPAGPRGGRAGHRPGDAAAGFGLLARRGRRVRRAQRLAGDRAERAEAVCSQVAAMVSMNDLADRPPRGWPTARSWRWAETIGALGRHSAPASRLGVRLHVRVVDADAALRRPVHAPGCRRPAAEHLGRADVVAGDARGGAVPSVAIDVRTRPCWRSSPATSRASRADARQLVPGRRCQAAACIR